MEALNIQLDTVKTRFQMAEASNLCPECGAVMAEVDRVENGGSTFIWFRCREEGCNGQWLKKEPVINIKTA